MGKRTFNRIVFTRVVASIVLASLLVIIVKFIESGNRIVFRNTSRLVLGADVTEFTNTLGTPVIERDSMFRRPVYWYMYKPSTDTSISPSVVFYHWQTQTVAGIDGRQHVFFLEYQLSIDEQHKNESLPKGFCNRFILDNSQLVKLSDYGSGVYKSPTLVGTFSSLPIVVDQNDLANGVYEVHTNYTHNFGTSQLIGCSVFIGNNYIK